jgi:GntR family transcriptional repressor for pyruvate dehydrogenase complex
MGLKFTPIKPKRIADQVFDQLRESILRGHLEPGDQIMSERELAAAFDVSRTSIREAINRLTAMGLIEQKQGRGTFVAFPSLEEKNALVAAMKGENLSIEDLLEVRIGLECNATYLAAERASEKDIYLMEQSIEALRDSVEKGALNADSDVSFHMAIAYATKNSLHIQIMRDLYDYLSTGIKENQYHLLEGSNAMNEIVQQHVKIADFIKKRDTERAFRAMFDHLRFVLDYVKNKKGVVL